MKKLALVSALVLMLLMASLTPTAVAANPDCFFEGSGHPGCRIVRINDAQFQVPVVNGSASLWLEILGDESAAQMWLVFYRDGQWQFAFFPASGTLGVNLQQPGTWHVELSDSPFGAGQVFDTMEVRLRPD
jgi:hypothetical protein